MTYLSGASSLTVAGAAADFHRFPFSSGGCTFLQRRQEQIGITGHLKNNLYANLISILKKVKSRQNVYKKTGNG